MRLLGFLGVIGFGTPFHHFQLLDARTLLLWIDSFTNDQPVQLDLPINMCSARVECARGYAV